jgi:hypothetical protein
VGTTALPHPSHRLAQRHAIAQARYTIAGARSAAARCVAPQARGADKPGSGP